MSLKIVVILFCTILPYSLSFQPEKWDSPNSSEQQIQEVSGFTDLNTVKFRFQWTINNIDKLMKSGERTSVDSPMFPMIISDSNEKLLWSLSLFNHNGDQLGVYLNYESKLENIQTKYNFSLLNGDTKSFETDNGKFSFRSDSRRDTQGNSQFAYYSNIKKYALIKDDKITILCEGESIVPSSQEIKSNMNEFETVKNILSNNTLITSDFDHKMLQEILHFLYTGKTMNLNNMHRSLLVAGDSMKLKTLFEEKLLSKLDVESAADIYMFMYLHEKTELKLQAIDFIKRNALQVMTTKGWMSLLDSSNSKMLAEIFQSFAAKDSMELTERPEV